jgi:outer membrane protein assembly factor BamB
MEGLEFLNLTLVLYSGTVPISYVRGSSELENLIDSDSSPVVEAGIVYTTNYQGNLTLFDVAQKRAIWQV